METEIYNIAGMKKPPSPEMYNFKPLIKELEAIPKSIHAKDKLPPVCEYCGRPMSM